MFALVDEEVDDDDERRGRTGSNAPNGLNGVFGINGSCCALVHGGVFGWGWEPTESVGSVGRGGLRGLLSHRTTLLTGD